MSITRLLFLRQCIYNDQTPKLTFLSSHFQSSPSSPSPSPFSDDPISFSVSPELLNNTNSDALPISVCLHLKFSHINPTPSLALSTLNLSPEAGRTVLGFHQWLLSNPNFTHSKKTVSFFVDYFGRCKDIKAINEVLSPSCLSLSHGPKTLHIADTVSFFEKMELEYGLKHNRESLTLVVGKLCEIGFASHAESMVKNLVNQFFPSGKICDLLVKAWCVEGKLDEATRLTGETYRGGFEIGDSACNAILHCVCQLFRDNDPFRLDSEAEKVLVEVEVHGVPRNVETFNVLIGNLCKLRRTEDAMKSFHRLGERSCYPDDTTFLVLIRSLYQAAGKGDKMIDRRGEGLELVGEESEFKSLVVVYVSSEKQWPGY